MWASTASKFTDSHDSKKHLNLLLKDMEFSGAKPALDALYAIALEFIGGWIIQKDFCSILGIVLVARNPPSGDAIDSLHDADKTHSCPAMHIISLLACVLE